MIPALFTGSRVYGQPRKDSDLDLVLLVSVEELELLRSITDTPEVEFSADVPVLAVSKKKVHLENITFRGMAIEAKADNNYETDYEAQCGKVEIFRFGKLNVIAVTDPVAFAVWEKGTKKLQEEEYVDRPLAVKTFKNLRSNHGIYIKEAKTKEF